MYIVVLSDIDQCGRMSHMSLKPDPKMVQKVHILRSGGMSFRNIAKKLSKELKSVYRWYLAGKKQGLYEKKLSTVYHLTPDNAKTILSAVVH